VPDIRNKAIIHTIPLKYKLDGNDVPGDVLGMHGNKLEVKTLFVTYPETHMNLFKETLKDGRVRVTDIVAGPIAESVALLTKKQKVAGVLLLSIGSGVTSLLVYENNVKIEVKTAHRERWKVLPDASWQARGDSTRVGWKGLSRMFKSEVFSLQVPEGQQGSGTASRKDCSNL
jgi:hypothetical protein